MSQAEAFALTCREWEQVGRLALPVRARALLRDIVDPRRHIRVALHADYHLNLALGAYAEHMHAEYLAGALDHAARCHAACVAEAKRIGRGDLIYQ